MNILSAFVLSAILLECVAASGDTSITRFKEAVDGKDFRWLNEQLEGWEKRHDLLDYVIEKGADVTVWFIHNAGCAMEDVLAALFDKGKKGMIDSVLEQVEYEDDHLCGLTYRRRELAGSLEKFFRVLDKIMKPRMQEHTVYWGVGNLLQSWKHRLGCPACGCTWEEGIQE